MTWDRLCSAESRTEYMRIGATWTTFSETPPPTTSRQIEAQPIHIHRYHLRIQR